MNVKHIQHSENAFLYTDTLKRKSILSEKIY